MQIPTKEELTKALKEALIADAIDHFKQWFGIDKHMIHDMPLYSTPKSIIKEIEEEFQSKKYTTERIEISGKNFLRIELKSDD